MRILECKKVGRYLLVWETVYCFSNNVTHRKKIFSMASQDSTLPLRLHPLRPVLSNPPLRPENCCLRARRNNADLVDHAGLDENYG